MYEGYLFSSTVDFLATSETDMIYTWTLLVIGYIVPNLLRDGVIASFVRDLAQAVATVRPQSRKIFDTLTENISDSGGA